MATSLPPPLHTFAFQEFAQCVLDKDSVNITSNNCWELNKNMVFNTNLLSSGFTITTNMKLNSDTIINHE